MGNTQVLTLRIPMELKKRLERQAKYQGTSINQLTNYTVPRDNLVGWFKTDPAKQQILAQTVQSRIGLPPNDFINLAMSQTNDRSLFQALLNTATRRT